MIGAIIGDIVGSRFEFGDPPQKGFELFTQECNYTDDTICTVAVADAVLRGIDYEQSLKEWCRRFNGIYTVADQSSAAVQRAAFAVALSGRFAGFADVAYPSWKSLFEALSRQAEAQDWHGPLVMDEFPYWVEADDAIPSVLQNWVDGEKGRGGIVCAIAGSVQHMMQGLVLDSDSPLYGRVDEKMKLPPIEIGYVKEALSLRSAVMRYGAACRGTGWPQNGLAAIWTLRLMNSC